MRSIYIFIVLMVLVAGWAIHKDFPELFDKYCVKQNIDIEGDKAYVITRLYYKGSLYRYWRDDLNHDNKESRRAEADSIIGYLKSF